MLGHPPAQLPNLYRGTLCKAKSMASATSPVKSVGQEVTKKVLRSSSDSHCSLQVSELFPKDIQILDSILKRIWPCRFSVSPKHSCVETTSFLVPRLAKAVKQLLHHMSWRCHIVVHIKSGQPRTDSSHPSPQTHAQKKC